VPYQLHCRRYREHDTSHPVMQSSNQLHNACLHSHSTAMWTLERACVDILGKHVRLEGRNTGGVLESVTSPASLITSPATSIMESTTDSPAASLTIKATFSGSLTPWNPQGAAWVYGSGNGAPSPKLEGREVSPKRGAGVKSIFHQIHRARCVLHMLFNVR
jgi:hypothetical protein